MVVMLGDTTWLWKTGIWKKVSKIFFSWMKNCLWQKLLAVICPNSLAMATSLVQHDTFRTDNTQRDISHLDLGMLVHLFQSVSSYRGVLHLRAWLGRHWFVLKSSNWVYGTNKSQPRNVPIPEKSLCPWTKHLWKAHSSPQHALRHTKSCRSLGEETKQCAHADSWCLLVSLNKIY